MGIPLGKHGREAVAVIKDGIDKTSAWVRLALALSVCALAIASLALIKAVRAS